jgi:phenylacetic acid degradation operon negative regulatory protein
VRRVTLSAPIIPHQARPRTIRAAFARTYGTLGPVHARSALFDLYGDHLLRRGGSAPVAALIRLLEPLGIRPPAVRTAVSRMVGQGWLTPVEIGSSPVPGYALTERARLRLDRAGSRIYRTDGEWDGLWHVRVLAPIAERRRRERVRSQLRFLGVAPLSDSTWVSPRASVEVDQLLLDEDLDAVCLTTADIGPVPALLAAFEFDSLADEYAAWLADAKDLLATLVAGAAARTGCESDDVAAFVVRTRLVHSWRKFLFTDPGLPEALLPREWPGRRAAAFFDQHAAQLLPATDRFIDLCLSPTVAGARP